MFSSYFQNQAHFIAFSFTLILTRKILLRILCIYVRLTLKVGMPILTKNLLPEKVIN